MKTIYTVFGETGEYSDHLSWAVRSYYDEKLAQQHVELATVRSNEIYSKYGSHYIHTFRLNEWDRKMRVDNFSSAHYFYTTTELVDELVPFPELEQS